MQNQERKTFNIFVSLALLVGFFLPWFKIADISISAWDIVFNQYSDIFGAIRYLLLILPITSILVLSGTLNKDKYLINQKLLFSLPLISLVLISIYTFSKISQISSGLNIQNTASNGILDAFSSGIWLSLLTSILLASLGFNFDIQPITSGSSSQNMSKNEIKKTEIPDDLRRKLFLASRIALIFTAMTFAFRASLEGVWVRYFHMSLEGVGWVFSPAFWGFTLAMVIGGPLCDSIGMKRLLIVAFISHLAGVIAYLIAHDTIMLFIGTVFIGIGNGMVEAACNPLTVSLYPEKKTAMLGRFHMWFPGGIMIGGLISYVLVEKLQLDWRILISTLFIPAFIYGFMFLKLKFPQTERVTSGVSTGRMFISCLNPLFLLMFFCMFITGATELGTNTWIVALLQGAGVSGILILVFINGLMAIGRSFAGPVVHKLNPNGMLIISSLLACVGLFLLSKASGYYAFGAALVFAAGICFFWPTMLGFVSEYLPNTGALGLSLMGGAGMFSTSLIVPMMGRWYDNFKDVAIASGTPANEADAVAGSNTFIKIAAMPIVVVVIFAVIYVARWQYYKKDNVHKQIAVSEPVAEL